MVYDNLRGHRCPKTKKKKKNFLANCSNEGDKMIVGKVLILTVLVIFDLNCTSQKKKICWVNEYIVNVSCLRSMSPTNIVVDIIILFIVALARKLLGHIFGGKRMGGRPLDMKFQNFKNKRGENFLSFSIPCLVKRIIYKFYIFKLY